MHKKIIIFSLFLLPIFGLGFFLLVQAQEAPAQVCGDGIIQSPNDNGEYEKCDDGAETEKCTATCGQKMLGWAWADTFGWLALNSENCLEKYLDPNLPEGVICNPGQAFYVQATAQNKLLGFAWSNNLGWVCFGETCNGVPPFGNLAAVIINDGSESPKITGWAKAVGLGDNGWISLSCENGGTCSQIDYGLRLNTGSFAGDQRLTLGGFAWNNNSENAGLGWLWFDPEISEIQPWLQTKYGDIYARAGLSGSNSPGYNATYRILSSGAIEQFRSAKGIDWWISPNFGPINFPTPETRYSNILGRLDVASLLCEFDGNNSCQNRQGKTVVDLTRQALVSAQTLGGKIYYQDGDLTVSSPIEFKNGSDFTDGAGTIIVNGNLTINRDITYDSSDNLTRFKNLASAAWIVLGDLKISGQVQNLAGNFIVIGNGQSQCESGNETGCGQITSCADTTDCGQFRLTVAGLLMARKFEFNRTFVNRYEVPPQGSEVIIYDGRLLANTPPGLGDFAKSLPIWRSGIFSR